MSKMTIRECMDAAYQLLNQYSIAGSLVPLSYNDQADAENRMINLINDAQMQIATTVRPIEASISITVPKAADGDPLTELSYDMPSDFNHIIAIYYTPTSGNVRMAKDANQYKWIGDDKLLLPNKPAGEYELIYNRFPTRYAANVDKSTQLDNKPDTHEIIPYYVAAMIAVDENPKAYYALYNVWETRLSRLGMKPAHAISTQIEDVYGFDSFGGLW